MSKKQIISLVVVIALLVGMVVAYIMIKKSNDEKANEGNEQPKVYDVLSFNADKANKLTYSYKDKTYVLNLENSSWVYETDKTMNVDQTSVISLIKSVSNITSGTKIENVTDFEQYGLTKPANKVEISTSEGKIEFSIGKCNATSGEYYFRVGQESAVYTVSEIIGKKFNVEIKDLCFDVEEDKATK